MSNLEGLSRGDVPVGMITLHQMHSCCNVIIAAVTCAGVYSIVGGWVE